jgi:hypothetical protein
MPCCIHFLDSNFDALVDPEMSSNTPEALLIVIRFYRTTGIMTLAICMVAINCT